MINPEPKAADFLSWGLPNSLNISSNGEPGGNWKGNGLADDLIVCVLDIFTTEGISLSAKSANELGTFCEFELDVKLKASMNTKKNVFNFDEVLMDLLIFFNWIIYQNMTAEEFHLIRKKFMKQ